MSPPFHNFSPSSMAIALLLFLMVLLPPPASSTSRDLLDHRAATATATTTAAKTGFRVKLRHVDGGGNYTKLELLQRGMKRGKKRMERLYAMALAASDATVSAPIHAGNGEFLMDLSIGTPPSPYSAILDTGSDLIWTQCKPCKQCFASPNPVFDPKKSSTFAKLPCSAALCTALPLSSCSDGSCEYLYTYGDYSSTQGIMATETFAFGDENSVAKLGFGCGLDNEGGGFNQGGGLVGLGRGPLSLVSQLDEPKFSYCLTSIDSTKSSTLLLGSVASVTNEKPTTTTIKTTPLIKNPSSPSFYYLSLEGITVGGTRLPIKKSRLALRDDGTGGMIIDSGTTITYLEESVFELVKTEFVKLVKLPVDESNGTGLDLCFTLPSSGETTVEVPKLVFHFSGADVELPGENYMIGDPSGVACLAMGASSGMSIFGNVQQQNMQVVHDLVKETISFVPKQCDEL